MAIATPAQPTLKISPSQANSAHSFLETNSASYRFTKKTGIYRIIAKEAKIEVAGKFFQGIFNISVNFRALFKN